VIVPLSFNITLAPLALPDVPVDVGFVLRGAETVVSVTLQNPLDCWIAFHGVSFDAVAPPRGNAALEIMIVPDRLGPVSILFDVTTNATPPFQLSFTGATVDPVFGFFGADRSPVPEVRMTTRDASGLVLLWNTGKVPVVLHELSVTSPVVGLQSNCSGSLAPGESCDIILSLVLEFIRTGKENGSVIANASGRSLSLDVDVMLPEIEFLELERARSRREVVVGASFVLALGPPLSAVLFFYLRTWAAPLVRSWSRSRKRKVAPAVDRQPPPQQTAATHIRRTTGGTWTATTTTTGEVTSEALADMATLIASLA
jgi:hypothetical protein